MGADFLGRPRCFLLGSANAGERDCHYRLMLPPRALTVRRQRRRIVILAAVTESRSAAFARRLVVDRLELHVAAGIGRRVAGVERVEVDLVVVHVHVLLQIDLRVRLEVAPAVGARDAAIGFPRAVLVLEVFVVELDVFVAELFGFENRLAISATFPSVDLLVVFLRQVRVECRDVREDLVADRADYLALVHLVMVVEILKIAPERRFTVDTVELLDIRYRARFAVEISVGGIVESAVANHALEQYRFQRQTFRYEMFPGLEMRQENVVRVEGLFADFTVEIEIVLLVSVEMRFHVRFLGESFLADRTREWFIVKMRPIMVFHKAAIVGLVSASLHCAF